MISPKLVKVVALFTNCDVLVVVVVVPVAGSTRAILNLAIQYKV